MFIKLKADDDGNFAFVEKYKPYRYTEGAIKLFMLVDAGVGMTEPVVFRGNKFIPIREIEKEMGIDKYIKAKKPFYSQLGNGNLIVSMNIAFDLQTYELVEEKSHYQAYTVVRDSLRFTKEGWSVNARMLRSSSLVLDDWFKGLAKEIAKTGFDRESFLKLRMK
jgi:hypothetical protein